MHGCQYHTTEIYMVSTKRESFLNCNHLAPVLFCSFPIAVMCHKTITKHEIILNHTQLAPELFF